MGTPEQIADRIAQWFQNDGADGFNLMPPSLPGEIADFVDHVVPVLQKRELFRQECITSTLRGHLELPWPALWPQHMNCNSYRYWSVNR